MKIKYTIVAITLFLLLTAISQIFNIFPYGGDIFPLYKSGYFNELDREFGIIKDSFISIKTLSKPVYAWIFLEDLKKGHDIDITVYDRKGYIVRAPGKMEPVHDNHIAQLLSIINPGVETKIMNNTYISVIPLKNEPECGFCHRGDNGSSVIGAMKFKRSFNPLIYYSMERIILFSIISIVLIIFLIILVRWDPERNIKELFDKTE